MRAPSQSNTSNANPSGMRGGTTGGKAAHALGSLPGRQPLQLGDAQYLWLLVLLEAGFIAWGRSAFRRRHGG